MYEFSFPIGSNSLPATTTVSSASVGIFRGQAKRVGHCLHAANTVIFVGIRSIVGHNHLGKIAALVIRILGLNSLFSGFNHTVHDIVGVGIVDLQTVGFGGNITLFIIGEAAKITFGISNFKKKKKKYKAVDKGDKIEA